MAIERFFLDTEFIEDGKTIELLSIGVVSEQGREFYAENSSANWDHASPWVQENVLPHLGGKNSRAWMSHSQIGREMVEFIAAAETILPEFWAYYGAYDWIAVCQLFGPMIDKPLYWPMMCMDVKQLAIDLGNPELPLQSTTEHHALADACWTQEAYNFLIGHANNKYNVGRLQSVYGHSSYGQSVSQNVPNDQ